MSTTVTTSIVVDVSPDRAFETFLDMGRWWNDDHHLIDNFASMEVERFVGGRIIDYATDGSTNSWATVLAFDPPHRFVFSWEISPEWEIEPDETRHSEVEITFVADGDDRTAVTLEHRHLDRHGKGWEAMRDSVGAGDGWPGHLREFASVAFAT
jgi:uncharacterized protein YndB with AHSA1/START domain